MPLPAALLARLAKRGIVNSEQKAAEETFAEDYTEEQEENFNPEQYQYKSSKRDENVWLDKVKRRFKETTKGVKGCPNKWNSHHICTVFCLEHWGQGETKPSKAYNERFQRLISRYPLQKDWISVWDNGCKAYYFWNKNDDMVSWLPPKHPKAVICKSAATLRKEKDRPNLLDTKDDDVEMAPFMPSSVAANRSPPRDEERYQRPAAMPKKRSRDLEKILRTKKGRKQYHETSDKIDPMDPAAYGTCPRGKWSSGLNPEERTGVDSTASGPLFQQRPLPSPGEILRANQAKRRKSNESDNNSD